MATHSSISAWRVPWTEDPGGLQSMGSKRVRHNCASFTQVQAHESVSSPLSLPMVLSPSPSLSSFGRCSLICQEVGLTVLAVPTLSLLFILNKHAPFWNTPCLEILFQPSHRPQHIYTMEDYSAIKKNEIIPFAATRIELETVILSEVRERQISYYIAYMWNLKKRVQTNLSTKQK